MNITKVVARSLLAVGLGCGCWLWLFKARAADAPASIPPVIEEGFAFWMKGGGPEGLLNIWQKGGLVEGDSKIATQASYLRRVSQAAGSYRSHELLETRTIGRTSRVLYLAINFDRGAVYARFLFYRTEKDWVVQNLDLSTRPEALMPWLAFEGERSAY